jgi:hypothetical protein
MTAGGVPAIDYGSLNADPANQPRSFRKAIDFLGGPDFNPGSCTVSRTCYLPNQLANGYILPLLQSLPNLKLFLRTTITDTVKGPNGDIEYLVAVQRTARNTSLEWTQRLSEELPDWYDPNDSAMFTKQVIQLHGKIFIEATELSDVLVTGNFSWTQGAEIPYENSTTTQSLCGQAWTMTFYMELLGEPPASEPLVPAGGGEGLPFPTWQPSGEDGWIRRTWNYRRSHCAGNTSADAVNVGDISQQNYGNDLDTAYVPLSDADTRAQRPWSGGLNLTALRMLEDRAYGYFHWVKQTPPVADWTDRLVLNYTTSGTRHGLSKFIYLRDSRRGFGLTEAELRAAGFYGTGLSGGWPPAPLRPSGGFRAMFYDVSQENVSAPGAPSIPQPDGIGLQIYNDDCHRLDTCMLPGYMANHTTHPFYLPARMMVQRGVGNLLLAGKTAAQTFHANGAIRLHPGEWTMGVAAGAAAVLFVQEQLANTSQLLHNYASELKAFVNSSSVGQPLQWADGGQPDPQAGFICAAFALAEPKLRTLPDTETWSRGVKAPAPAATRCVGTDKQSQGAHELFPSSTCSADCTALAADEWLALDQYWTEPDASGVITAKQATVLKKSVSQSRFLPSNEIKDAPGNTPCTLVSLHKFGAYWLCTASN